MKNEIEIQRAHDIFAAITLEEIDLGFVKPDLQEMKIALSILCWMLEHEHSTKMNDVLKWIDEEMKIRNIKMILLEKPMTRIEFESEFPNFAQDR